jgi:hypothetical protein
MRQAFTRLFLILIVCSFVVSIGRGQSINPDDKNWDSRFTLPCTDGRINSMIGGPDGALYIGGDFNYVEGLLVKGLAKWDGHHWSRVGNWRGGYVRQMLFWKSELYVGGYLFGSADSNRPVAKYDGTSWFPVGNSIWYHDSLYTDHAQVNSLTIFRGDLWLAGSFNTGAGKSYEGVAILRDSFWQAAKAINSGPLYLGGIKLQATDSTLFLMVGVSAANGGDVPVLKQFTDFGDWLTVDSNSWLAVTASYRNTLIATGTSGRRLEWHGLGLARNTKESTIRKHRTTLCRWPESVRRRLAPNNRHTAGIFSREMEWQKLVEVNGFRGYCRWAEFWRVSHRKKWE